MTTPALSLTSLEALRRMWVVTNLNKKIVRPLFWEQQDEPTEV